MEKLPEDNTLLPKYNTKLSPEQLTRVIKDGYKVAAFHGSLNAMNRVAEAYFYGIGVEQSDEQVSIWSKVIENIYPILHQSAINNNNTNIQKLSFDKTNYIRILLNNPNKNKPEQESLLNELNKNGMLQKTILPRVSVSQQISSQKKINELMKQIQSDYTNWLETRDQDTPKP